MRSRPYASTAVIAALLATAAPAPAVQTSTPAAREVVMNLRNAELELVAEQVARLTGRTIVLDPAVQGRVSVVSASPLSPAGVWELFRSVLRVNGFAVVQSGSVWRVVPQATAVQGGARIDTRGTARAQEVVTRLIRLRNLPSAEAVRVLRPLVASFGSIEASTQPNAVIVTDYAENVRRIEQIARSLDGGEGTSFQAINLRHAGAAEVGQAIQRILGEETAGGPRIAVDERSNVILVRGTAASIAEARRVAALLDTPASVSLTTRVIRLRHSDAEAITDILRGLLGGAAEATNPVARALAPRAGAAALGAGPLSQSDTSGSALAAGLALAAGQAQAGAAPAPAPSAAGFTSEDVSIQPSRELNAIVVRGSPAVIASIEALVSELDLRRPQVMIEAAIVEITGDISEQLGIQLGVGPAAQLGNAAGTSFTTAGISLRQILTVLGAPASVALGIEGGTLSLGSAGDFGILVQALGQSTKANLLSTPSLTTLDNQPAEIVVGQNVPFRTGSFTTQGNVSNPFTTIEREDVGITLRVVPRVHDGDVVKLEVSQEVSSLVNANVIGAADLITNRRSIRTTVLADNGETIVLGGLITDDRLSSRSQVPVLGDIPILGELFKSRRESQTKRTLFVFLRPTILRDKADVAAQAGAQYSRLRSEEALQEETRGLLANPPGARLPVEIQGVY